MILASYNATTKMCSVNQGTCSLFLFIVHHSKAFSYTIPDYFALSAGFHFSFLQVSLIARKNEASPIETGYYFSCNFKAFLESCQPCTVNQRHLFE